MQAFEMHPMDTLFFRDARPMKANAGSGGHGANWPVPVVIHGAVRTRLLQVAGLVGGSLTGSAKADGRRDRKVGSLAYGSLRTLGPLPRKDGVFYYPCSRDVVPDGNGGIDYLTPHDAAGANNLPAPWLRSLTAKVRPGKERLPEWVSSDVFRRLLAGEAVERPVDPKLYVEEPRIGIEIDPGTGTVKEGQLYTARHLRLGENVSLWIAAELSGRDPTTEEYPVQLRDGLGGSVCVGGEGRVCRLIPAEADPIATIAPPLPSRHVKWVLAGPAVFNGGWRPHWIDETDGKVRLKKGDAERRPEESRRQWRTRLNGLGEIGARLVAARVDKAVHFSGWDLVEGGPKTTCMAVPSGCVYFFEADSEEDGAALVDALHGRVRSDLFGEKGMGLGFCGTWSATS